MEKRGNWMDLWWHGTDVLLLNEIPPGISFWQRLNIHKRRFLTKYIFDKYTIKHVVAHELLKKELQTFGVKKEIQIIPAPIWFAKPFKKTKHSKFTLFFYLPKSNKFNNWLYGYDYFLEVKKLFTDIDYLIIDGKQDMSKIFPIVDFYLRPNRHDGDPRLVRECKINKIPFYWSQTNPQKTEIIKAITNAKNKFYSK